MEHRAVDAQRDPDVDHRGDRHRDARPVVERAQRDHDDRDDDEEPGGEPPPIGGVAGEPRLDAREHAAHGDRIRRGLEPVRDAFAE